MAGAVSCRKDISSSSGYPLQATLHFAFRCYPAARGRKNGDWAKRGKVVAALEIAEEAALKNIKCVVLPVTDWFSKYVASKPAEHS